MLKYVALSAAVHALIISVADVRLPQDPVPTPTLKVSLTARAASQATARHARQTLPNAPETLLGTIHANKRNVAVEDDRASAVKRLTDEEAEKVTGSPPIPVRDDGRQLSTVIHRAHYRRQAPPVYPRRALELGQEGTVTLHAEVVPTGRSRRLKVARSSGHRLLDRAALAAVRTWEFEPTRVDGNMVTSWVRVPVRFVIR